MSSNDDGGLGMRALRTPREVGLAIRRARGDRAWTQAELASRAGVGRQWLSELESGKKTAELGRVCSVLDALDLAILLTPPATSSAIDLDALD
jgi:HTH-type transcriptional regulator/antitoxin HipB